MYLLTIIHGLLRTEVALVADRYRFNKDTVQNYIFPLIRDDLSEADQRGRPIPPIIKLLTALRFYATGSFQVKLFFQIIIQAIVFV